MLTALILLFALNTAQATSRAETRFNQTIRRVEHMVSDPSAQQLARRNGLSLVNVTWEDTGRSKHSSLGPNISDMTIGVRDSSGKLHPMPVFRFNNYHDKTADLNADDLWVKTGNETGDRLTSTRLVDLLDDVRDYLHDPSSMKNRNDSLLADRDSHLLVSAQACFLPISSAGEAVFTPVLYNYQSRPGAPAVMTIVATREGTSIQVVENNNGYMSEELFFNADGDRAPFTATRLSTFKRNGGDSITSAHEATEGAGLDVVLVIQVPLQHAPIRPFYSLGGTDDGGMFVAEESITAAPQSLKATRRGGGGTRSNVESTVIGHGEVEGVHSEINGLTIKRDTRFPIRVTAQFYKATSNGVVNASDVAELRKQIDRVYANGDYVGSLVTDGLTNRPTEWVKRRRTTAPRWASPIESWHKAF